MPAPPVPRLMHKRPVRRIHQSNNPLVHMRRQLAGQMRNPIILAKRRQFRCWNSSRRFARLLLCEFLCTLRLRVIFFFSLTFSSTRHRDPRTRIHVNPKISVALFARIMPRKNALHLQFVLASQRRNLNALSAASLKFPSVITALQVLPIKSPMRKRNPAVRARIAHRKRCTLGRASQNQRHFQQHRRRQSVPGNFRASHRRIPKIPKKSGIAFCNGFPHSRASLHQGLHRFAHRYGIVVHRVAPEQPASAAAAQQQRRASQCLSCIRATEDRIQLRGTDFSVILDDESNDVRYLLLADPASLAFVASQPFLRYSLSTTRYSLF